MIRFILPRYLTSRDLAECLHYTQSSIIRLMKKHEIPPAIKVGHCWRWDLEAFQMWLTDKNDHILDF